MNTAIQEPRGQPITELRPGADTASAPADAGVPATPVPVSWGGHEVNAPGFDQDRFDRAMARAFVDDLQAYPVLEEGKTIRYNDRFRSAGTNVNFAQLPQSREPLFVRTYERGVEDETFSCGTGVTATAIAASFKGLSSPVSIRTLGGNLEVSFRRQGQQVSDIYLTGPAQKVFAGVIDVK